MLGDGVEVAAMRAMRKRGKGEKMTLQWLHLLICCRKWWRNMHTDTQKKVFPCTNRRWFLYERILNILLTLQIILLFSAAPFFKHHCILSHVMLTDKEPSKALFSVAYLKPFVGDKMEYCKRWERTAGLRRERALVKKKTESASWHWFMSEGTWWNHLLLRRWTDWE